MLNKNLFQQKINELRFKLRYRFKIQDTDRYYEIIKNHIDDFKFSLVINQVLANKLLATGEVDREQLNKELGKVKNRADLNEYSFKSGECSDCNGIGLIYTRDKNNSRVVFKCPCNISKHNIEYWNGQKGFTKE